MGFLVGAGTTRDGAGDEMLFVLVLGGGFGIWIGGSLGCWAGLRLRRHDRAGPTAALLALLGPLWAFATGGFVDSEELLSWLGPATSIAGGILNYLMLAVAPLAARAIVVWFSSEPPAEP